MDTEKVTTYKQGFSLTSEELRRLTEFFSLLIKIDRRNKARKEVNRYENQGIRKDGKSRASL